MNRSIIGSLVFAVSYATTVVDPVGAAIAYESEIPLSGMYPGW